MYGYPTQHENGHLERSKIKMSDVHYQQRNSQNLQALIDNIKSIEVPRIEYKQLGGMVLLGKGHNSTDVKTIDEGAWDRRWGGKIGVMKDRDHQKLIMYVDPNPGRPQTSDQSQLEDAVKHAVESMTIGEKKWKVEFIWSNIG